MVFTGSALGDSSVEYLVFSQKVGDQNIIYAYQPDTLTLIQVVRGAGISVFLQGKYFLYFNEQKLYQYDIIARKSKELTSFKEKELYLEVIPGGPEQALVVAKDNYNVNWYVLELSDGSVRRVKQPPITVTDSRTPKVPSPDEKSMAVLKTAAFSQKFILAVEERINGKFKKTWSLPDDLTVIPDWPVWSPDSKHLAFYAKKADGFEGFYSLYLLDLPAKELKLVEKQVFAKYIFSEIGMKAFIPAWSGDGKYLLFQSQPNGLPNMSMITRYDVTTGKKQVLTESSGSNDYPAWSSDDQYISFLSNRDTRERQLYIMDKHGANLKRVSPEQGFTEWARWYRPR